MLRGHRGFWVFVLLPVILGAFIFVIGMVSGCYNEPRPEVPGSYRPPTETFSDRCREVHERLGGKSLLGEDGEVCDLYERMAELERRLAALE